MCRAQSALDGGAHALFGWLAGPHGLRAQALACSSDGSCRILHGKLAGGHGGLCIFDGVVVPSYDNVDVTAVCCC